MKLLILAGKKIQQNDTLLLLQDNKLFGYSTAALKIAAHLGFPWRIFVIFRIVPVLIRDSVYRHIARNRYSWFGRKSFCINYTKGFKERFIS
jgi:predicted DCC family thiol-disulfide oxidoreductase YuxK